MAGFSWAPVSGYCCQATSDAHMAWQQQPLCYSQIISLEVCEAREHQDILVGSLMVHKATDPQALLPPESLTCCLTPAISKLPFSPSTYKLPLARLHLLSKHPQTGQHFLHSEAMQGISLLRPLDPFQKRKAARFPPPAPSSETRCKFGPWRLCLCFHFCP